MPLWVVFVSIGLIKLVVASLMLWLPFRADMAVAMVDEEFRSDDGEGGGKVVAAGPVDPHPRLPRGPRRGPHDAGSPHAPARVREYTGRRANARVASHR